MKPRNKLIQSASIIAVGLAAIMAPALTNAEDWKPDYRTKALLRPGQGGGQVRPEAPSRVYIECYYSTGSLTFVLPPSIYSTTVDLSNDWNTWSGFVTRDQPTLDIPDLEGDYTIKCNADDGKTYIGTLEF